MREQVREKENNEFKQYMNLTAQEIAERRAAFNDWYRRNRQRLGIHLIPANRQDSIMNLMRSAFNAGSNWEAKVCYDQDRATDCKE